MHDDKYIILENLKRLFSKDQLFLEVLRDGVKEEILFPHFVQNLMLNKVYTSAEVAAMVEKHESIIRYYIKELFDYIQPLKPNRNYRYDYITIYRIYLIIIFLKVKGRNLSDIKEIVYAIRLNHNNEHHELLTEKVVAIEQNINHFGHMEKLHNEKETKFKSMGMEKQIENVIAVLNEWSQFQQKVIEVDIQIEKLRIQYYHLKTAIFEAERRLFYLENEFFQGIVNLEINNHMHNMENKLREKNKSPFRKISSALNIELTPSISVKESNLLSVQKEINKERDLLKKQENEFAAVQGEMEAVSKLKLNIIKSLDALKLLDR